jgi:hypothetical protein
MDLYSATVYLFAQGRGVELTREKVRGTMLHKAVRKHHVYKLYETPEKTTFRVWYLYTYLVHVAGFLYEYLITISLPSEPFSPNSHLPKSLVKFSIINIALVKYLFSIHMNNPCSCTHILYYFLIIINIDKWIPKITRAEKEKL